MKDRSSAKSCSPNARAVHSGCRANICGGRPNTAAMIADIAAASYQVVGDLDDLTVDPTDERTEALTDAGCSTSRWARWPLSSSRQPCRRPAALADTNGRMWCAAYGARRWAFGGENAVARQNLMSRGVLSRVSRSTVLPSSGFASTMSSYECRVDNERPPSVPH